MLKIKEDKMQELEKLGFKKVEYYDNTCFKFTKFIGNHEVRNIIVRADTRIIKYNIMSAKNNLDDMVFDLIQAGLVEKVDKGE